MGLQALHIYPPSPFNEAKKRCQTDMMRSYHGFVSDTHSFASIVPSWDWRLVSVVRYLPFSELVRVLFFFCKMPLKAVGVNVLSRLHVGKVMPRVTRKLPSSRQESVLLKACDLNSARKTGRCNCKPAMDQWGIARLTEAVRECEGRLREAIVCVDVKRLPPRSFPANHESGRTQVAIH